ncbi:hypothetical protein BH24ACT26_BH24ACT26_00320 [soil metagenome]
MADPPQLREYAALVRAWAPRLDLVAPGDLGRFEERHLADCLRAAPLVGSLPPGPAVDVGTGAGLPGIPLAIVGPQRRWRLLERRRNRIAFLEEAVRVLGLNCSVHGMSAEEAARDPRFAHTHIVAVARAVAPPEASFDLLEPLVAPTGVSLVFVGGATRIPPRAEVWRDGLAIIRQGGGRREGG